ncbi:MAG: hypothetical protein IT561_08860 [Alphaproteobacteria bacterium]|nr:hypothetical protein [Alphaproteobacteria bacterium]
MRRVLMIMLLCLVPSLSFAQQAPSITITPPKIETSGITVKQVVVVVAALAAGVVVGEWLLGGALGSWVGAAAGAVAGIWAYEEYGEQIDDL